MIMGLVLVVVGAAVTVAAAVLLKKYLHTRYDISVDEFDRKFRHERMIASEELTSEDAYEGIAEQYGITPQLLDAAIRQKSVQDSDDASDDSEEITEKLKIGENGRKND